MTVRSRTLAASSVGAAGATLYTVPADRTAILKSIVVGKTGTPAQTVTLTIVRSAVTYGLLVNSLGIGASSAHHTVYVILQPGDQVRGQTDVGTVTLWLSGVELAGVAPA